MSLTSTVSVNKQPNIQDAFLSAARRAAKQQVIYKHAISTIAPEHPIELEL